MNEREKATLTREIVQGSVTRTEMVEAEIVWINGKPEWPNYLGDPTGASDWKIIDAKPIEETVTEEAEEQPAEPEGSDNEEDPNAYSGEFKTGDRVVIIRVDNTDKKNGLKVGHRGTVKIVEKMTLPRIVTDHDKKEDPYGHCVTDDQMVLARNYKLDEPKKEKKKTTKAKA